MNTWNNIQLQDSASPIMEQLLFFDDHTLLIITIITIWVGQLMINLITNSFSNRLLLEGLTIELIWTILPALTLIFIAAPSLRLIYIIDEINNPMISIKSIGQQWHWSYEHSDLKNIEFDSYMKPFDNLNNFNFRLIDVDNWMIIPFKSEVRLIITPMGVIHSWTIPSLGVKIDATPGRLNQASFFINRPGLFFRQCSEICGAKHSFMHIVIESISSKVFNKWMMN